MASGVAAVARRLGARSATVVAYHNVVEPADAGLGDSDLHMPLDRFVDQIDWLARTHRVVDLETAARGGGEGRPQAVITFDDAYRGAVTLALPELARRGLPAVVFVCPGLLGARRTWWDEAADAGLLSEGFKRRAFAEHAGREDAIRRHLLPAAREARDLPGSYGIATAEELRRHCRNGIVIGSHAWAHEHLQALDRKELENTLARTLAWLEAFDGTVSPWLALPFGAGSRELGGVALEMGHAGVLGIGGGRWDRGRDRILVPRIDVRAGLSWRGLALRASGIYTSFR